MDGRITALRVGFLSSSHQLAGVEFSIASSPRKNRTGLVSIYWYFFGEVIVLTAVVGLFCLAGFLTLELGAPFPHSAVLREFRQESCGGAKAGATKTGSFGDKLFFVFCVSLDFFFFRGASLHQKLGASDGQD